MHCLLYQEYCGRKRPISFYLNCFFVLESLLAGCPNIPVEFPWASSSWSLPIWKCSCFSSRRPLLVHPLCSTFLYSCCMLPFFTDRKLHEGKDCIVPISVSLHYTLPPPTKLTYNKCWLTELFLRLSGMKTLGDGKMPKMSLVSEPLDDWPFKSPHYWSVRCISTWLRCS